jgi:hypothetical protein
MSRQFSAVNSLRSRGREPPAPRPTALDLLLRLRRVLVAGVTRSLFCALHLAWLSSAGRIRYPRCSRRQPAGDHGGWFYTFDSPFQRKAATIV